MKAEVWLPAVLGLVGGVIGAGGIGGLWLIPAQRRKYDVDGVTALANASAVLMGPLEARVQSLTSEVDETRRQLRASADAAEELARYLRRLMGHIHDPVMTIERLRVLAGDASSIPPTNGRPS